MLRRGLILAVLLGTACSTAPRGRVFPPGQLRAAKATKKACFVAGTPVTLADGTTRAIEDLAVGDKVLSFDEASDAVAEGVVTARMVHPDTPALLRINGELTTTPEHLFFVQGSWVAAGQLREGDALKEVRLVSGQAISTPLRVTALEPLPGGVTTYNLEVTPHHVYFADGVLVHNAKKR